jgi:hypothetical protein
MVAERHPEKRFPFGRRDGRKRHEYKTYNNSMAQKYR